jgi:hypothetical protein
MAYNWNLGIFTIFATKDLHMRRGSCRRGDRDCVEKWRSQLRFNGSFKAEHRPRVLQTGGRIGEDVKRI